MVTQPLHLYKVMKTRGFDVCFATNGVACSAPYAAQLAMGDSAQREQAAQLVEHHLTVLGVLARDVRAAGASSHSSTAYASTKMLYRLLLVPLKQPR